MGARKGSLRPCSPTSRTRTLTGALEDPQRPGSEGRALPGPDAVWHCAGAPWSPTCIQTQAWGCLCPERPLLSGCCPWVCPAGTVTSAHVSGLCLCSRQGQGTPCVTRAHLLLSAAQPLPRLASSYLCRRRMDGEQSPSPLSGFLYMGCAGHALFPSLVSRKLKRNQLFPAEVKHNWW